MVKSIGGHDAPKSALATATVATVIIPVRPCLTTKKILHVLVVNVSPHLNCVFALLGRVENG